MLIQTFVSLRKIRAGIWPEAYLQKVGLVTDDELEPGAVATGSQFEID